jgi:hypothetical protein
MTEGKIEFAHPDHDDAMLLLMRHNIYGQFGHVFNSLFNFVL